MWKNVKINSVMTERLLQLIDYLNISVREFERKIGVTEGVISKSLARKTGLKAETLQKIAEIFPQITLEWLLLGEGEMLRTQRDGQPECSGSATEIELLKAAIRDKEKIIEGLEENQRLLKEKIDFLEAKLARCDGMSAGAAAG